jgi:hypothetical protein
MEIDPVETASEAHEKSSRLVSLVAVTVALLATFMGVCNIKDDNIKQAMERAESERLDHWNFYQARNIREEVMMATAAQMRSAAAGVPATAPSAYRDTAARYEALATDQNKKKEELRLAALEDAKTYDALNYRDDQFDIAEALIALAISLLAMTALTQRRWLFMVALVPTFFGLLMGVAGLLGWHIHPDILAGWLS